MYIYKGTHLPRDGWLQGCFICTNITSKTEKYELSITVPNIRFVLFCCPLCRNMRKKSNKLEKRLQKQVSKYVDNNITQLI